MVDNICSQEFPDDLFESCRGEVVGLGIIDIKCDTPLGLISGVQKLNKSTHTLSISFSVAARKAKALRKQLKAFGPPKPYKHYGVGYYNLSLKKKLLFKFLLTHKF